MKLKRTEVIKLIALCSGSYRNWPEVGKETATIEAWELLLGDIPFDVGQSAVKMHLSRSVYPPTIADIRDAAAKITEPPIMDAIEAWDLILKAIRKFGHYREADAIESLPADVAQMAKRFTWRELCLNENPDTIRAQFRMAWETQSKRLKERNILPDEIVAMIEAPGIIKRLN